MGFDDLLDRLFFFDYEVFAHDVLMVAIDYRTHTRHVFHNSSCEAYQSFVDKYNPILCGYNSRSYDKFILKACLLGYGPEEIKGINDYIIDGNQGWQYPFEGYYELPYVWDLFDFLKTFKSLKEIEGNLRMNITETTVPFDLPNKWNTQQYEEVLYYCTADVEALIPVFEIFIKKYRAKFVICKLGHIEPDFGLSLTDANLTATLLGAEKQEHDDPFLYDYPEQVQKEKIPEEALEYFDDLIAHNDLDYKREAPELDLGTILFQLGVGGCHGFIKEGSYFYDRGDELLCE